MSRPEYSGPHVCQEHQGPGRPRLRTLDPSELRRFTPTVPVTVREPGEPVVRGLLVRETAGVSAKEGGAQVAPRGVVVQLIDGGTRWFPWSWCSF